MSSPASTDFGVLLNLAFGAFKLALNRHLADAGFTDLGPAFGYVFRLLDGQACQLSEVAAALQITPQGALKIINDMVDKGYVVRGERSADDGRVKRLVLGARGRAALAAARQFHASYEADLAHTLGEPALAATRTVLLQMVAAQGLDAQQRPRPL